MHHPPPGEGITQTTDSLAASPQPFLNLWKRTEKGPAPDPESKGTVRVTPVSSHNPSAAARQRWRAGAGPSLRDAGACIRFFLSKWQ